DGQMGPGAGAAARGSAWAVARGGARGLTSARQNTEDDMKKIILAAALLTAFGTTGASAALAVGAKATDFTAQASLGGKEFTFSLADALKKGPVVLYFYPAAFTSGCTVEAHEFAEATDKFAALGATVIGVSADNIDKLDKFSVSECRS